MKIGRLIRRALLPVRKRRHLSKYSTASPGTTDWLVGTEIKYGGIETCVPRNKVSPRDLRTKKQLSLGGMIGGDRMLHHAYAKKYSEHLLPYVKTGKSVTVVEPLACCSISGQGIPLEIPRSCIGPISVTYLP